MSKRKPSAAVKPVPGSELLDESGVPDFGLSGGITQALDEQREALWLAQAMVDTVEPAIQRVFGSDGDWLAKYPEFPRVLREVSRILNTVSGNLENGVLEERALAIARAKESQS